MGMSTSVVGLKPVDEKWQQMFDIYAACDRAGIDAPPEVSKFFEGVYFKYIEKTGIIVDLEKSDCVSEFSADSQSGFEVEVAKIPKDVKVIRFYNSW